MRRPPARSRARSIRHKPDLEKKRWDPVLRELWLLRTSGRLGRDGALSSLTAAALSPERGLAPLLRRRAGAEVMVFDRRETQYIESIAAW
jgi:hypothetical protein